MLRDGKGGAEQPMTILWGVMCSGCGAQIPLWAEVVISMNSASVIKVQIFGRNSMLSQEKTFDLLCVLFSRVASYYYFLFCIIVCFNWNLNNSN